MASAEIQKEFMKAIEDGNLECAEHFLSQGADVNAWDVLGKSPLGIAARNNSFLTILWLLRHHADRNSHDQVGYTPLLTALFSHSTNAATALIACRDVDVNLAALNGKTPLMLAIWDVVEEGRPLEMVWLLLNSGADPTISDTYYGQTPLAYATEKSQLEIVSMLEDAIDRWDIV